MNEVMMCFELATSLKEVGDRVIPTVVATVQSVLGNTLSLTTTPSATPDIFFGGQMNVTSGAAVGLRCGIVQSAGNQIILAAAFVGLVRPVPGDTVELSGGPLSGAKIFMHEPSTVRASDDTAFFVTVNVVSTKLVLRALNKLLKGWLNFGRTYDFEVVCEAPYLTGDGNDLNSVRNALYDLKVLKEQVEILVVDFRMQEKNRIYGTGDIDGTYAMIQRTGSPYAKHAAILDFGIRVV